MFIGLSTRCRGGYPKEIEEYPPGGAWTFVDGRFNPGALILNENQFFMKM